MGRRFTNASNQYFTIAGTPDTRGAVYTVSLWVNSPLTVGYDAMTDFNNLFKLYIKSNGTTAFYEAGTGKWDGTGSASLSSNVWYNYVVVNRSSGITGYLNAAVDATNGTPISAVSGGTWYLGHDTTNAHDSDSKIADVAMWKAALDLPEIRALATGVLRPPQIRNQALIAWWPLDERGGVARNYARTGLTGVPTSSAPTHSENPPKLRRDIPEMYRQRSRPLFWSGFDALGWIPQVTAAANSIGPLVGGSLVNNSKVLSGRLVA